MKVRIDEELYFELLKKYGVRRLSKGVNELLHLVLSGKIRDP